MYFCIVADDTSPMLQAKYPSDQKIFFFQYCLERKALYFCHKQKVVSCLITFTILQLCLSYRNLLEDEYGLCLLCRLYLLPISILCLNLTNNYHIICLVKYQRKEYIYGAANNNSKDTNICH